jgi:SAM-dependent methyltransferase
MNTNSQKQAFESLFSADCARWAFHDTKDPLTRYLRDRRMNIALGFLERRLGSDLRSCSVLVSCGGVGGEASYFANQGFTNVTNSDFSENALAVCRQRDSRIKTLQINGEQMDLADNSFDLVLVQDGLHHLPRPALGLNEMARVARRAVVVIEPHAGLVARLIGTKWERHGDAVNFVFRWNQEFFEQVLLSQLLEAPLEIRVFRVWDHNSAVRKIVSKLGGGRASLAAAKLIYGCLAPLNFVGNNMVGVAIKGI